MCLSACTHASDYVNGDCVLRCSLNRASTLEGGFAAEPLVYGGSEDESPANSGLLAPSSGRTGYVPHTPENSTMEE